MNGLVNRVGKIEEQLFPEQKFHVVMVNAGETNEAAIKRVVGIDHDKIPEDYFLIVLNFHSNKNNQLAEDNSLSK